MVVAATGEASDGRELRVVLSGGIGNQLFQFAAGLGIAGRRSEALVFDTVSGFRDDHFYGRSFSLDAFPGLDSIKRVSHPSARIWIWMRLRRRESGRVTAGLFKVLDEKIHGKSPEAAEFSGRVVRMVGFWQDERYFRDVAGEIKERLAPGLVSAPANSVAVHVRRVQYTRGVGRDYFNAAVRLARKKLGQCRFDLYTDDPAWGAEFSASQADFSLQSRPGIDPMVDFQSMIRHRHFIISNSTYSWWAAWLGEREDSLVIAPGRTSWANPATPPERWRLI